MLGDPPRRARWLAGAIVAAAVFAGCGGDDDGDEPQPAPFGYSGAEGPAHWASLDPDYAECSAGKRQSPIALEGGEAAELPAIDFAYEPAGDLDAENNGHSVEVAYPPGSSAVIDGEEYELDQFHYHAPSEHTLNGRSFPLEFHFVHLAEDGAVTVVGVFAEEGEANPAFSGLVQALPPEEGESQPVEGEVNALALLPADASTGPRWSYEGSLTTPPCTEPVRWNVLSEPIELSREQIAAYTAVFAHTNRPLQPRNGRELLVSR